MTTLVLVGGFLGAGKTSLILRAASMLRARGLRCAVVTNDQDEGLVDTALARSRQLAVAEVAGGCFCCRFSSLLDALGRVPPSDVIFAEPVGSCVDISATILQPLKAYHSDRYRLAPFTVLVDPARITDSEDMRFLLDHQLKEADVVCAAKSDLGGDVPGADFRVSAVTGEGIAEWLEEVLACRRVAGARLLDVDYDRYAQAEAALGWVNLHAMLAVDDARSPSQVAGPLLDELDARLTAAGIRIAHLKLFDRAATGYVKVSLCENGAEPLPEGDLAASPARDHELVVNLRALGDPEELRRIVEETLGPARVTFVRAFRPARPQPEHRFTCNVIATEM